MPSCSRDRVGHRLRVAGQHRHLDAQLVQPPDGLAPIRAGWRRPRRRRPETRCPRPDRSPPGRGRRRVGELASSAGARRPVGRAGSARPRRAAAVHRRPARRSPGSPRSPWTRDVEPALGGARHDRARHRDARRPARAPRRAGAPPSSASPSTVRMPDDPVLAERERAGLVEDDRVEQCVPPRARAGRAPGGRSARRASWRWR